MAIVRPFEGVRYDLSKFPDPCSLLSPPFDTISAQMREELIKRHPNNCIRLILGDPSITDGNPNRYKEAAEEFRSCRQKGILIEDQEPAIYLLEDRFQWKGKELVRRGFLLTVELEELGERYIFPHEQTYEAAIEDRLKLLTASKTQFSPIYMVFEDEGWGVRRIINDWVKEEPLFECKNLDHPISHRLWKIVDPSHIEKIVQLLRPKPFLIADGHHRYTTALRYSKNEGRNLREARWLLTYAAPAPDPGVVLSPIHRWISKEATSFLKNLASLGSLEETTRSYKTFESSSAPLAILTGPTAMHLFHPNKDAWSKIDPDLKDVPTALLHQAVVPSLDPKKLKYFVDPDELSQAVEKEGVGVWLKEQTVTKILSIVKKKKLLPQKSTYFYPKVMVGFVFHPLE